MPYKDKQKLYAAQKRYRKRKKQLKEKVRMLPAEKKAKLKREFPDVYEYFFGKGRTLRK